MKRFLRNLWLLLTRYDLQEEFDFLMVLNKSHTQTVEELQMYIRIFEVLYPMDKLKHISAGLADGTFLSPARKWDVDKWGPPPLCSSIAEEVLEIMKEKVVKAMRGKSSKK